jgi:hypothetical protein
MAKRLPRVGKIGIKTRDNSMEFADLRGKG